MGISRDKAHKRRATGGKKKRIRMKRKYEMGRQPASTKIGEKKITRIRVRGGNYKFRALRLDHGNYSWAGEAVTRKTRILKVVYNSTNNELVRTNTLVKGSIIQIDSTPFKAWYLQYYNIDLSNKLEIQAATDKKLLVKEKEEKATTKKGGAEKPKKEGEKGPAKKDEPKPAKGKAAEGEKPAKGKAAAETEKPAKGKAAETEKPAKGKAAETEKPSTKKTAAKPAEGEKPAKQQATAERKSTKGLKDATTAGKAAKSTGKEDKNRKALSKGALEKFEKRNSYRILEPGLADQFKTGRLYAKISSRPGQSGRCDGYILEGEELAFYLKKITLKKKK